MWKFIRISVAIAVVAVLYAGAMAFYQMDLTWRLPFTRRDHAVAVDQPLVVSDQGEKAVQVSPDPGVRIAQTHLPVTVRPTVQSREQIMSGLPAYGRMSFMLPLEAEVTDGRITLSFRAEIPETVYATLRVSLNGRRRAETVLQAGTYEREVSFDLSSEDLSRKNSNVSIALVGNSYVNICAIDQTASVISFLPETRIEISTKEPVTTLVDRFRILGGEMLMAWPGADAHSIGDVVTTLSSVMASGIPAGIVSPSGEPGFTPEEARLLLEESLQIDADLQPAAWPVDIGSDSTNSGAREFTGRTTWKYRYRPGDLPGGLLPGMLTYALRLGPMETDEGESRKWAVWFKLNGRLLAAMESGPGILQGALSLPADMQAEDNQIEISAGRPFGTDGVCNAGPLYVAELLPETRLTAGNVTPTVGSSRLRTLLGDAPVLDDGNLSDLTRHEAYAAAKLISGFPILPGLPPNESSSSYLRISRPMDAIRENNHEVIFLSEKGRVMMAGQKGSGASEMMDNAVVIIIGKYGEIEE